MASIGWLSLRPEKSVMRNLLVYSFLSVFAISCLDGPDCIEKRNNLVGISFVKYSDFKTALSQEIDTITAKGASVAFSGKITASTIVVPLDYLNDTTFLDLSIAGTDYPLVLTYESKAQFISDDCGEKYVLGGLNVAEHHFDSVNIINGTPGINSNVSNIIIFRK